MHIPGGARWGPSRVWGLTHEAPFQNIMSSWRSGEARSGRPALQTRACGWRARPGVQTGGWLVRRGCRRRPSGGVSGPNGDCPCVTARVCPVCWRVAACHPCAIVPAGSSVAACWRGGGCRRRPRRRVNRPMRARARRQWRHKPPSPQPVSGVLLHHIFFGKRQEAQAAGVGGRRGASGMNNWPTGAVVATRVARSADRG